LFFDLFEFENVRAIIAFVLIDRNRKSQILDIYFAFWIFCSTGNKTCNRGSKNKKPFAKIKCLICKTLASSRTKPRPGDKSFPHKGRK